MKAMTTSEFIRHLIDGASTITLLSVEQPAFKKRHKPWKSDLEALRSDWQKIGGDMRRALQRVEHGEGGMP